MSFGGIEGEVQSGTLEQQRYLDNKAWLHAMDFLTMSSVPAALKAAVLLNVPETIAKAGPGAGLTAEELALRVVPGKQLNAVYLDRILRVLASQDFFSETMVKQSDDTKMVRRYGLLPVSYYFIKNKEGVSSVPILLMSQDPIIMDFWQQLHSTALDETCEPFKKAHGKSAFEYGTEDPRFNAVFNAAMSNHSLIFMQLVLGAYQGFGDVKRLVDVGGGLGSSISLITKKYPHIQGVNYDQPHVVATAPSYPGVEHKGGDMFESVPSGDAIFMKWILHDWNDDDCIKLLKNCYEALPPNGKVIAVESVVPVDVDHGAGARMIFRMDLIMLAFSPLGAKERTEEELRRLAMAAGFSSLDSVVTLGELSVLEFVKHEV